MEDDACQGLHNLSLSEESTLAQCIQEKYARLILQSKELVSEGNVEEALKCNQTAYRLCPSEKLQRKIQRMQAYLKENSNEVNGNDEEVTKTSHANRNEASSSSSSPKVSSSSLSLAGTTTSPSSSSPSRAGQTTSPSPVQTQQNLTEEDQVKYTMLISEARQMVEETKIPEALHLNRKALRILYSDKLERKIQRMEMYIQQNNLSEVSDCLEKPMAVTNSGGKSSVGSISSTSEALVDEVDQSKFARLVSEAKDLTTKGQVKEALELYKEAAKISPSDKLSRKIEKMEEHLRQNAADNHPEISYGSDKKDENMEAAAPSSSQADTVAPDNAEENQYVKLVSRAKDLTEDGHVKEALSLYRLAAEIKPSEKLHRKMKRMEDYLRENGIPVEDEELSKAAESKEKTSADMECDESYQSATNRHQSADRDIKSTNRDTQSTNRGSQSTIRDTQSTNRDMQSTDRDTQSTNRDIQSSDRDIQSSDRDIQSSDRDINSLSEEEQVQYVTLVSQAKEQMLQGRATEALLSYKQAAEVCPSNKLQAKIQKLQNFLKESQRSNQDRNENLVKTPEVITEKTSSKRPSGNNDPGTLTVEQQRKYNELVVKAKKLATDGKIKEALDCNKRALAICFSDKLEKRIQKMKSYLANDEEEEGGMVHMGSGFFLYRDLVKNLYAHQKQGVRWMWELHQKRKGGILGDDMGLGKTIQVISFLSGLFDMDKVHAAMIVMPVSVIGNWEKEFGKWAPGIHVEFYHGSKKEKERSLAKIRRKGGVLLTSYGMIVTSWEMMSQQDGRPFKWDYLILDEGHKIKNTTKTTKGVHQIPANHRILLTGTPIQNNLREMWSLFDFVHQGTLLGTARTFKMEYENPITRARERDATANERTLGMEMAESLKQIISPYFLRRTKAEVKEKEEKGELDTSLSTKSLKMPSMTRKNDFILWLYLTPDQQRIYRDFLSLDSVKELLMTKKSPLVALTVLKKICDHPRLLSRRACAQLGLDGEHALDDSALESEEGHQCAANQIKNMPDNVLVQESGKLIVIMDLLDQMKREGHRCLVFSQSRKMLDIIHQLITNRGHKVMRLDGTVTQLSERDKRIATFQGDKSYSVFLLTTQVGGVGLTLTAADRVIIYDPSWNPATDAQAVDRVFRIGQDKNVVIYRLITCGTVEEKIYRRQIFKDSITRQTTGNSKNPYRYFTKQELRELFTLDNPRVSKTQQQLEEMHSHQRNTDSSLDSHIAFLYSLDIFGISDHDLMFTQEKCDLEEVGEAEVDPGTDYIQHRVQKAKELLQMESDLTQDFEQRAGKFQRNVPIGPEGSGLEKPFSRPWADWNLQGTISAQEEEVKDMQEIDLDAEDVDKDEEDEEEEEQTRKGLEASHIDLVTPEPTPVKVTGMVNLLESTTKPGVRVKMESDSPRTAIKSENDKREIKMEVQSPAEHLQKMEESFEDVQVLEHAEAVTGLQNSPVLKEANVEVLESDGEDHKEELSRGLTPSKKSREMEGKMMDSEEEEDKENIPLSQIIASAKRSSDEFKLNRSTDGLRRSPLVPVIISPVITGSPAKKKLRRSVSQSPWLKQSPPETKMENVVQDEEVFISPDASRPLMGTKSKLNSDRFRSRTNLNSTIFSAFSDSPQRLDSPLGIKRIEPRFQETFVEESPDRLHSVSGLEQSVVPNSVQNTPDVSLSASDVLKHDSMNIGETDEESSFVKSVSLSKSESVVESLLGDDVSNSDDVMPSNNQSKIEMELDDKMALNTEKNSEDDAPSNNQSEIRIELEDDSPSNNQSEIEIESEDDLPSKNQSKIEIESDDDLATFHVKKKSVRKAIIESDTESDGTDINSEEDAPRGATGKNGKKRKSDQSSGLRQSKYVLLSSSDNEQSEDQEDSRSSGSGEEEEASIDLGMDSEDEDLQNLSEDLKETYQVTVKRAKEFYRSGKYEDCLINILQALEINPENTVLQAFALQVNSKMEG